MFIRILISTIGILLFANLWSYFLLKEIKDKANFQFVQSYFLMFNFDQELNFPTFFSTFQLLFAGILLAYIAFNNFEKKGQYTFAWFMLALVFIYLSIDEVAQIHEMLGSPMRSIIKPKGVLRFSPWMIGMSPLVAIFLIAYSKFFFHLPPQTRTMVAIALVMFLSGALIFEFLRGVFIILLDRSYSFILYTIEELLEMGGVMVFICALLGYIKKTKTLNLERGFNSTA